MHDISRTVRWRSFRRYVLRRLERDPSASARGPVGDHTLCAMANDLRVRERLARAPDGCRPLATCENPVRHFLGEAVGGSTLVGPTTARARASVEAPATPLGLQSCLVTPSARAYGSEVSSSHESGRDRGARAPDVHCAKDIAGHPRSTMRQTTREKLDLNMPLTSRNILVEMVARAGIEPATFRFSGGRSYQLSYLAGRHRASPPLATLTGLEPATSAVTGRRANQLRHRALLYCCSTFARRVYPLRDSNPRYRLERAAS